MSRSDWFHEFIQNAVQEGRTDLLALPRLLDEGWDVSAENGEERFAVFARGEAEARRLSQPWWVLTFQVWQVETALHCLSDVSRGLQIASRATLEARKSQYDGFPLRITLTLGLIWCYLKLDPKGYEREILDAFSYCENILQDEEDQLYLLQTRGKFWRYLGDARALDACWDYFEAAQKSGSGTSVAWSITHLLDAMYLYDLENARQMTGELAAFALEVTGPYQKERTEVECLAWGAVSTRWNGFEEEAARIAKLAEKKRRQLSRPRDDGLLGLRAFHEVAGDWAGALRTVQTNIWELRGRKLDFETASLRLDKIALLRKAGRDSVREEERFLKLTQKLKSREWWRERLENLHP